MTLPFSSPTRSSRDILPMLEQMVQSGKKLVIMGRGLWRATALSTLIVNKLRGTFTSACAVKAPGFGDRRKGNAGRISLSSPAAPSSPPTWAMS